MKNRPTSKRLFAEFVKKFRRGEFKSHWPDAADGQESTARIGSRSRHGFVRLYIRRLWTHWPLVTLLVVLAILVSILEIVQPLFARYIIDQVLLADATAEEKIGRLNSVGLLFLGLVSFTILLGVARNWNQRLLNFRVMLTLRRALFERLLKLPLNQLSEMKVGGILSRLTDDINLTSGLMHMAIISPGVAVLRLLVAMGILFAINWKLALTALGIIPPIMLLSMIFISRVRPIYRAIRKDVSRVDGRVAEAFSGIRDVRAFRGEQREALEYAVGHHSITRMRLFAGKREILVWSAWGFIISLNTVVVLWAGGFWYVRGEATIGDIGAFQIYVLYLLNPVWQIVESLTELQRSLAAMERVFDVLESPIDKPDQPDAVECALDVEEIRFENVCFAYEGSSRLVIDDFNLIVPEGSVVALVGRSGAGKTTITDLVSRFYDPTHGRILLNGVDLRTIKLESYRQRLGVVQQEVFLFDGTVFENIAYADRQATLDDVKAAAILAHAHEFIVQLPEGYQSLIGERGVKLSGGQRQRLSIARALLADPRILILDEATSNLDSESEQLIQASMAELLKNRTTFVIAHRLSTITHADIIVVMEQGKIVETGTHDELIRAEGFYADMIRRQNESLGGLNQHNHRDPPIQV